MAVLSLMLLVVLGGFATLVALIVLAIANRRLGAALLIGGLGFMGLLFGVALLFMFFWYSQSRVDPGAMKSLGNPVISTPHWTINGVPQPTPISLTRDNTTWNIAITPLIFIVVGILALLVLAARRGFSRSAACGRGRIWPAFVALPLLALFVLGNARYQSSTNRRGADLAQQTNEATRKQQEAIMRQQQAVAQRVASMSANVQKQIEDMDIHELMDKFDAPRIALQAPMAPTAAPAVLFAAAAAQAGVAPLPPLPPLAATVSPPKPTNVGKDRRSSKQKRPASSAESFAAASSASKDDHSIHASAHAENHAAPSASSDDPLSNPFKFEKPVGAESPTHDSASTRPSWVNNPPKRVGDVQSEVIVTDEWSTEEECERARNIGLMLKVYEHIQKLIGVPYQSNLADHKLSSELASADSRLTRLTSSGVTLDYALREIAKDEYVESVERSVGPMKKMYTLVEFTPKVDQELRERWDGYRRQMQFSKVGVSAASVLGLLSVVWGLLKIDTATKGYYTKRLFLGVPAAIIGIALLLWADPLHIF